MKYLNRQTLQKITNTSIFSNFLNLGSIQLSNTILSFLIYIVAVRKVGLEAFGLFSLSNNFAGVMATFINYGTSQSGVKDIAMNNDDQHSLSSSFYSTLIIRIIIFSAFLTVFSILKLGDLTNYSFYLFSIPIILSEVLNPIFLYLGKQQLMLFNIVNLIGKAATILLIVVFISGASDAIWINFIIGATNTGIYIYLIIHGIIKYRLKFILNKAEILKLAKSNFYLVINNISVNLQPSLMVFSINWWGNPLWLGAYAICDKVIQAVKLMTATLANAIYPKAATLYKTSYLSFIQFKKQVKKVFFFTFLTISACISIFAGPIITLINGEPNTSAELILRIMAFLPMLSAINAINVVELLIKDQNIFIFRIAIILLILAATLSMSIVLWGNLFWFGTYTLLMEIGAILMYEYVIKRTSVKYI